ncbi:MAG: beta-phosphoglucomutase [Flavobacteriaceae bacterium]
MKKHLCALFDLDGVVVDTAKYHYLAWREIASKFDYDLTEKDNEQLKGVSRIESLKLILEWANVSLEKEKFNLLLAEKNNTYLGYIETLGPEEILPGIKEGLLQLQENKIKIGLGSASKNAKIILDKLELTSFFGAIIDGNQVEKGKPNPEIFLKGAAALQVAPEKCVVFEDSVVGIQAAKAAKMTAVALGIPDSFSQYDYCYTDFTPLTANGLAQLF